VVADYEYRALSLPVGASPRAAREILGIHAEYGDWELVQHAIWPGGRREVTVRRKMRAEPLPPPPQ
jgi:hypothetical protein